MRTLVPTLAFAALALTGCAMSPAETARYSAPTQDADRAALGQQLAGLRPAETKDCMDNFRQSSSLKAYGSTLVYRVSDRWFTSTNRRRLRSVSSAATSW